jgi:hypothetical protein
LAQTPTKPVGRTPTKPVDLKVSTKRVGLDADETGRPDADKAGRLEGIDEASRPGRRRNRSARRRRRLVGPNKPTKRLGPEVANTDRRRTKHGAPA